LTLVLLGYKLETVKEQREHQRFNLRLPFQVVGSGRNAKTTGETKNVSSAGVLFTSKMPVAVGEPIEYVITFPTPPGSRSEVRLRCVGKVLREDTESAFAATLERYEFQRQSA
jgi:PilZ domain-containing protein